MNKPINEAIKVAISDFHYIYNDGSLDDIENWFNTIYKNSSEEDKLAVYKNFLNRSLVYTGLSYNFDTASRKNYEKAEKERLIKVIEQFDINEQLNLISKLDIDGHFYFDIFKVLKKEQMTQEQLEQNVVINDFASQYFSKEAFSELELLENTLNIDFKKMKNNYCRYYYKNKSGSGGMYLKLAKFNVKPYYDIVFNYTETKEKYLESRNLKLPNHKITHKLKEKIKDYFETNAKKGYYTHTTQQEEVFSKIENYDILYNYKKLNKNIKDKEESNKNVMRKKV